MILNRDFCLNMAKVRPEALRLCNNMHSPELFEQRGILEINSYTYIKAIILTAWLALQLSRYTQHLLKSLPR